MISQDKFNHSKQIIGVIGHPVQHSFSPLMHNLSFEMAGLEYIYLPFDVPATSLKDALKGIVALNMKGLNVTLPHKEKILQYLSEISEEANIIGAVNTIVNESGELHGYNTDVQGVVESLNEYKNEITGQDFSVIGAGGAARSVIYALIRNFKPSSISIINRTAQKAESLKEYFSQKMLFNNFKTYELLPPDLVNVFKNSKLIVNATNAGMSPDIDDAATTIPESFNKDQVVFDVVYNPSQTKLLKIAAAQGAKTVDGLKMFVEQGARSYELWTGEKMNKEKIYTAVKSYLET